MEYNIDASLIVCLNLSDELTSIRVVNINVSIRGTRYHFVTIQAEIAFYGESRNTMAFISPVLVKSKWRLGRENCYVVSIRLCYEFGIRRVASYRGTCICFTVNLKVFTKLAFFYRKQIRFGK